MPFSTGTAVGASDLLNKINTHLVANGWSKLRGETDMVPASPKAARYWRFVVLETQTTSSSTRGLQLLNFRTTPGGANVATVAANFTISEVSIGSASLLISGGVVRSSNISSRRPWWITYDFGSPTTIREVYARADSSTGSTPRSFTIQWSNDNITWTTMYEAQSISWSASAYQTFTFNDTYLEAIHHSASIARRSGAFEDLTADSVFEGSGLRHFSDAQFVWQGDGYDANRRVYIHARPHSFTGTSTEMLEFNFSVGFNTNLKGWTEQDGASANSSVLLFGAGTVTYWIYSNSKRIIVVVKTGASDYTSAYVGFMSAFAQPDYYPFPLAMSATMYDRTAFNYGTTNNLLSSAADPGFLALCVRYADGTVKRGGNRTNSTTDGFTVSGSSSPFPFAWPHFFGRSGTNHQWPTNHGAGTPGSIYSNQTLFEKLVPTQQNDLPLIPVIVMDHVLGNLGALDGLYSIPGGGILAAEQVLTISAQDYRVFPNRTRRLGATWLAVRED